MPLVGQQEEHLACKKWGMVEVGTGWSRWLGTCEALRFDSISNRTSDSGFNA